MSQKIFDQRWRPKNWKWTYAFIIHKWAYPEAPACRKIPSFGSRNFPFKIPFLVRWCSATWDFSRRFNLASHRSPSFTIPELPERLPNCPSLRLGNCLSMHRTAAPVPSQHCPHDHWSLSQEQLRWPCLKGMICWGGTPPVVSVVII